MPNYSLVIGSKFKPFSYQEMLAPVLQQTEAQQDIEEKYAVLNAEANKWKHIAEEEPNSDAAKMYNKYADDLKANAAVLAMSGLNPSSRQNMFDMSTRYSSEIIPIQTAYEQKMKEIEEQLKAGNDTVFSYDARTRSIDEYMKHPTEKYAAMDLTLPYKAALAEFGQLSKILAGITNGKPLDKYTNTYMTKKGLTVEDVSKYSDLIRNNRLDLIPANSKLGQAIKSIADGIYNTYEQNWGETSDINDRILNSISRGIVAGIGEESINTYDNYQNRLAAQMALKDAGKKPKLNTNMPWMPRNPEASVTKEQNKLRSKIAEYKELKKKIEKDPSILTAEKFNPYAFDNQVYPNTPAYINKEKASKYKDRIRFEELNKELTDIFAQQYPNYGGEITSYTYNESPITDYSFKAQYNNKPTVTFNSDFEDFIDNLGTIETGYSMYGTDAVKKATTDILIDMANVKGRGDKKGNNKYIELVNSKGREETKENIDLKKLDWDKASSVYFEGGKRYIDVDGETYRLLPGAFGALDEGYDIIERAYSEGEFNTYDQYLKQYMTNFYDIVTSRAQGQENTSSNLNLDLF